MTIRTVRFGVVRAEETQKDLYAAIDLACDKIARSLRKMKVRARSAHIYGMQRCSLPYRIDVTTSFA